MLSRLFFVLFVSTSLLAQADEITICYNYGCNTTAQISLRGHQLQQLKQLFKQLPDAPAERLAIAQAIGLFETFAGEQTPTRNDKGGNENDDGVDGRMDCIDHSHNSTAYLRVMETHGWLKFHRVLEPVKRAPLLVNIRWGAHIQEIKSQREFVIDSWFFDNGHPAAVFDLDDWLRGASPDA